MIDEKGEQWKANWSSGLGTDNPILAFESSYFHRPKKLLSRGKCSALDKDNMDVVVDTNLGKLIKRPDDSLGYVERLVTANTKS